MIKREISQQKVVFAQIPNTIAIANECTRTFINKSGINIQIENVQIFRKEFLQTKTI